MIPRIVLIGVCILVLANVDSLLCQKQGLQKETQSACTGKVPITVYDKNTKRVEDNPKCYEDIVIASGDPTHQPVSFYSPATTPAWVPGTRYFPLSVKMMTTSFQEIVNRQTPNCNSFNIDAAEACLRDAIFDWNSVCPENSDIKIIYTQDEVYEGFVDVTSDRTLFGSKLAEWQETTAIAMKFTASLRDLQGNIIDIIYNKDPNCDPVIYINNSSEFRKQHSWSTSCPCDIECTANNTKLCSSFCHVIKHEIGHLYGLLHYEDCKDNSAYNKWGIMSADSYSYDPVLDEHLLNEICNYDLRTEDICFMCRRFCTLSCPTSTILDELQSRVPSNISIYPNPSTSEINIMTSESEFGYKLISEIGQVMLEGKSMSNRVSLDISAIAHGVYFIYVQTALYSSVKYLIKK